jgi:hypothetical protein
MSQSPSGDEGHEDGSRSFANIAGLIAVIVIIALGYWAYSYLDLQRRLQNCLDSGRRDCAQLVNPQR